MLTLPVQRMVVKHRDCIICSYRQNETIPATGEHERNYCDVNGDGLKMCKMLFY